MNHRVVSGQLLCQRRTDRRPELIHGARPIGEPVQRSAITEHDRRIVAVTGVLELALNVKDRPLRRALALEVFFAREATAEEHTGRYRQHSYMRAKRFVNQLEHGSFSGAGPSGQHDSPSHMRLSAFAIDHDSSASDLMSSLRAQSDTTTVL